MVGGHGGLLREFVSVGIGLLNYKAVREFWQSQLFIRFNFVYFKGIAR